MTPDYNQLLKDYPKSMSLEQMRIVCHISKKTARLLLQTGLVRCKNTGKKTYTYKITKAAVIKYLTERETTPEKYILLSGRYAKKRPAAISNTDFSVENHTDPLLCEDYPDVLTVQQAAVLSGVTPDTVKAWAKKKHLKAFIKNNAWHIPKLTLIEYLESPRHKRNAAWKRNNLSKRRESDIIGC